ncbi:unnamed protein product [Rhodiola kirilowii]
MFVHKSKTTQTVASRHVDPSTQSNTALPKNPSGLSRHDHPSFSLRSAITHQLSFRYRFRLQRLQPIRPPSELPLFDGGGAAPCLEYSSLADGLALAAMNLRTVTVGNGFVSSPVIFVVGPQQLDSRKSIRVKLLDSRKST